MIKDYEKIYKEYQKGSTVTEICCKYDVTPQSIYEAFRRRKYLLYKREVTEETINLWLSIAEDITYAKNNLDDDEKDDLLILIKQNL
jgi:hypothetical protein